MVFCNQEQEDLSLTDDCSQGVLYIVDTKQELERIKGMGLPVLVWLHGSNKEESLRLAKKLWFEDAGMGCTVLKKCYEKFFRKLLL